MNAIEPPVNSTDGPMNPENRHPSDVALSLKDYNAHDPVHVYAAECAAGDSIQNGLVDRLAKVYATLYDAAYDSAYSEYEHVYPDHRGLLDGDERLLACDRAATYVAGRTMARIYKW